MKTLLAAFSIMMLVGAVSGCGDDTTTAGPDMTAAADMSATPRDMQLLTCSQILSCSSTCTTQACATACISEGKAASQQKAGALLNCAIAACASDGGVDANCAKGVVAQAVSGTGPCKTEGAACLSDM